MDNDALWPSVVVAAHLTEETLTERTNKTIEVYDGTVRVEDATAIGGYAMSYDGWYGSILVTDPLKNTYTFEPVIGEYETRGFCVEARIFLTDSSSNRTIASRGTATTNGWSFTTYGSGLMFTLFNPTGGTAFIQAIAINSITLNTWHHVAASIENDGSGTVTRLFVDGVEVATAFGTDGEYAQPAANTAPLRIGSSGNAGSSFIGKIQMFRLTLATRYYYDFTPPTELFASEPAYFTGTVMDADNQPAVRMVRAHRKSDGASYGEAVSSWIDGSFSAPAMDSSPHYIIAWGGVENALIFDDVTLA